MVWTRNSDGSYTSSHGYTATKNSSGGLTMSKTSSSSSSSSSSSGSSGATTVYLKADTSKITSSQASALKSGNYTVSGTTSGTVTYTNGSTKTYSNGKVVSSSSSSSSVPVLTGTGGGTISLKSASPNATVPSGGITSTSQTSNTGLAKGSTVGSGTNTATVTLESYSKEGYGHEAYKINDSKTAFAGISSDALEEYYKEKQKEAEVKGDVDRSEYFGQQANNLVAVNAYKDAHPEIDTLYGEGTGVSYEAWTADKYDQSTGTVYRDENEAYAITGYPSFGDEYGTMEKTAMIGASTVQYTSSLAPKESSSSELKAGENAESTNANGLSVMQYASNAVDSVLNGIDDLADQGIGGLIGNVAINIVAPVDAIKLGKKITDGRWDEITVWDGINAAVDVIAYVPVVGWGAKAVKTALTVGGTLGSAYLQSALETSSDTSTSGGNNVDTTTDILKTNTNPTQLTIYNPGEYTKKTNPDESGAGGVSQQDAESRSLSEILSGILAGLGSSSGSSDGGVTVVTGSSGSSFSDIIENVKPYIIPATVVIVGLIGLSMIFKNKKAKAA